jgi:ubiquitin carboxyl-terminal hydrolase 4/11/15
MADSAAAIPPSSEQAKQIKLLMKTTSLRPDAPAYLISCQWLESWKRSVGFNCTSLDTAVPPIDNSKLLLGNELKPGLLEGMDFDIVTSEVWHQLFAWYRGAPEFPRPVEINPRNNRPVVHVYPTDIEVHYHSKHVEISYSLFQPILGLKILVCARFECDPDHARLCDFFNRIRQIVLDDSKFLCDYHLDESCPLLLETQNRHGSWEILPETRKEVKAFMPTSPGLCGLMNLGNTCYMNAALQSLAHLHLLTASLRAHWNSDLNRVNPLGTKGAVVTAYIDLLDRLWDRDNGCVAARVFRDTVCDFADQFVGRHQHDSHEYLAQVLDFLHEDLNRIIDKPPAIELFGDGTNDADVADRFWRSYKNRNDSVIVDLFHGLFRSQLTCPNCNQISVVFDPYSSISVPLPIPIYTTPQFLFVPFDLTKPRILMDIAVVGDFSIIDIVEALCDKFHRRMQIAFAERPHSSTDLRWKAFLVKDYPENELIAFELPEGSSDSVLVPARLLAPIGKSDIELNSFFLVEMPSEVVDNAVMEVACTDRFEPLFVGPIGGVDDKKLETLKGKVKELKARFNPGQKVKCSVVGKFGKANDLFQRNEIVKRVATQRIDVRVNPDEMEGAFRWDLVRNTVVDIQMSAKGKRITKTTLGDCLENFAKEEILDESNKAFCPHCREFVKAAKKMDIWTVPTLLVIQLKRFFSKGLYQKKLEQDVHYPDELDMSQYMAQTVGVTNYRLIAVINHTGGLAGGHYIADVLHPNLHKWHRFNDQTVRQITRAVAHSDGGYVLFYERVDD